MDHPNVFLSLLPEPAGSRGAEALRAALTPGVTVTVLTAPVQGIHFFAARGDLAWELDDWWQRNVPAEGRAVLLVMHEPGLERHLAGVDSELIVGVADEAERSRYGGLRHASAIVTPDPLALVEHAIASYSCFLAAPLRSTPPVWSPPAPPPPTRPEPEPAPPVTVAPAFQPAPPQPAPAESPGLLFMPRLDSRAPPRTGPAVVEAPAGPLLDPFTALSTVEELPPEHAIAVRPAGELTRANLFHSRRRHRTGDLWAWLDLARLFRQQQRPIVIPREIGDLVLGLHPAPLIVVPGRKGGVGKTVTAGAIAQVVGYALGDTTGSAAIVDQNIGNPDQWGRLDIPPNAGTVRQLMAALSNGNELPPTPAWAKTPALAVYPEDRSSVDAYPPGLIQRFVHLLRERHVFIVVDLPNRLPDYSSAEAAICAAYLDLADLVILPTTDDPTALLGAMEYLDIPSMRDKPVIVSHIVSTDRQLRRHPVVTELLSEIQRRVVALETIPRSEKATLAIVKGMSILDISAQLREAYIRVAQAAVRALAAGA